VTTVVVVKKAGQVAIAADTLVTFGDTRLSHRYEANSKLFKVDTPTGPSWVGMAGTVAHFPVLRKAMNALPKDQLLLGSRDEVFDTFVKLHPLLKESFFLQTKEDDNDPYESSQFSVVIANAERHLRPVQLPRGVRVQGVLGHRLRTRLCTRGHARGLGQGPLGP
jgi:ATP-dependent HslUV protease subunit HslV